MELYAELLKEHSLNEKFKEIYLFLRDDVSGRGQLNFILASTTNWRALFPHVLPEVLDPRLSVRPHPLEREFYERLSDGIADDQRVERGLPNNLYEG